MNEFIDILSRLLIATITFVAPMMIFCFGIFYEALMDSHKAKRKQEQDEVDRAYDEMGAPDVDRVKVIKETSKKIQVKPYQKTIFFLLNPQNQIAIIFIFLFVAIGSLMLSHLVLGNVWGSNSHQCWRILIWTSLFSYGLSVLFILLFVRNIFLMKKKLEEKRLGKL